MIMFLAKGFDTSFLGRIGRDVAVATIGTTETVAGVLIVAVVVVFV